MSPIASIVRFALLILVSLCLFVQGALCLRDYEPDRGSAIEEPWRWSSLESLKGKPIVCAAADGKGVLWMGTTTGLASYDGVEYQNHPYGDVAGFGLPTCVMPSDWGAVYVNTVTGLFVWTQEGGWSQMLSYPGEQRTRNIRAAWTREGDILLGAQSSLARISQGRLTLLGSVPHAVTSVVIDNQNRLWLSTLEDGRVYSCSLDDPSLLENSDTWRIYDTTPGRKPQKTMLYWRRSGELWAVNSLPDCPPLRFDAQQDVWKVVDRVSSQMDSHKHEDLIEASDGTLLIHTRNSLVVEARDGWKELRHPEYKIPSSTPFLVNLADGAFVMGARGDTTFKIDMTNESWDSLYGLHFQCEGEDGMQWFLSRSGEAVRFDPSRSEWVAFDAEDGVIDSASALFLSSDGVLWALGSHSGRAAVSLWDGTFWERRIHAEVGTRFSYLSARELQDGTVLFGVGNLPFEENDSTGGIVAYRKEGGQYRSRRLREGWIDQRVVGIAEVTPTELWLGGELLKHQENGHTETITDLSFLNNIWIDHLMKDTRGDLWLAIGGVGVARKSGANWTLFSEEDGLVSNQVVYLEEDFSKPGHIWVATDEGVGHFDGKSWTDALFPSSFAINRESGTLKQSRDGSLWLNFGDRDWYFRTEVAKDSESNRGSGFRTIRYRKQVGAPCIEILDYEPRLAEPGYPYFSWKGVDRWTRTSSEQLEYSFRLDRGDWSSYDRKTETILLRVEPGKHQFEVRVRDGDGNESVEHALAQFVVVPPLWKRPWFIGLASIVSLALLASIYTIIRQRIRRIIELEEFKIQFFTNLSHELRTPLTVIIGPLERLVAKQDGHLPNALLSLALKNARKMNHIVDQLLDFRKSESAKMPELRVKDDLLRFVRHELDLHQPLVEDKGQTLDFSSNIDRYITWLDYDKLEKILSNLLSNAIKFTPEGGIVCVRLHVEVEDGLELIVEDQGPGISEAEQESVFEPFVQGSSARLIKRRGTGIGLALARRLARTCGGEISVESPCLADGVSGSRFILELPIRNGSNAESSAGSLPASHEGDTKEDSNESSQDKMTLLVVDDSDDVRGFLVSELGDDYFVIQARDGEEGLALALEQVPDAIVSDVAMPIMDGNELCRRLKENEATCHIPIVMLTAHKTPRHELASLELGADDFVGKPVNVEILKNRIQNLISARERLRRMFSESARVIDLIPRSAVVEDKDRVFLEKARQIVLDNLQNTQFDVERFAESLGMSRMTLYRKVKAVTDMSPNAFIRSVRLKLAAAGLKTGKYTVSEIAENVGYQELSYFSASFKKQFGVTPSEYAKKEDA
ncbi:ATP-binding protein [Pelagicoccus sp. SDUM812002]|uniref:ATP-binding protein n=1 Tax=Pelagicoccus sp. SDUM812002 TaxID=3041266 RepID=UPI00280C6034|nr:ATP-binding protein [Pelagicoccus sp. SDUM812002]MDQ8184185.1 ATP-binding protein [Pelagicoccus sp. SDUM812002]